MAKLQEQGINNQIIYRRINDLCRPSIIFDACVIKECKTAKSGTITSFQVLESGGVILHSEKSQTRCNFHSTPSNSDTFLPLWLREKEIQIEGSGLIIAYGKTSPTIKADGIQFVEQELVLNGQGENESSIIQKNTSQILLIVENSKLNSSGLTVELWGAKASLIRSQGNGMSIIDGLRVNGRKLEGAFVQGSIFEVISGGLSLINIQIKDVNVIENNQGRISENQLRNKMKGLIEMKENAQVLYIEKIFITDVNIEQTEKINNWSSIMMNGGHLKLRDSTFLGETYTSVGIAI
ncbi:MAG: hypothetical protein EZS28_045295, partial [Streblomastix strix]